MKNWRLRRKMLACFFPVLVMIVAMGIVSMICVEGLSSVNAEYADQTVPAVNNIWSVRYNLTEVRQCILSTMLAETDEEFQESKSILEADMTSIESVLAEMDRLLPDFHDTITEISDRVALTKQNQQKILSLGASLESEDQDSAYEIYRSQCIPIIQEINELVTQLIDEVENEVTAEQQKADLVKLIATVLVFVVLVIAIVIAMIASRLLTKSIVTPLKEIDNAMQKLADGDFENATVAYHSKDELGRLADGIRRTIDKLTFIIEDLDKELEAIANGDFTKRSKNEEIYTGVYHALAGYAHKTIDNLNKTLWKINLVADEVAGGGEQVAHSSQSLSSGATQQASAVQELTVTIDEISRNIGQNAESATIAREQAESANHMVEQSNYQMKEMIEAMDNINTASEKIGKIIMTIEDIAFQTNILALNAAVEAARAGSAGKGFAVVADEVRNLAHKSSVAAKNTTELIQDSIETVEKGTGIAHATADKMEQVVSDVAQVVVRIDEIAKVTQEQAASLTQVSAGVEQISDVVQTTSATAEETATASEQLFGQATMLKKLLSVFKFSTDPSENSAYK